MKSSERSEGKEGKERRKIESELLENQKQGGWRSEGCVENASRM